MHCSRTGKADKVEINFLISLNDDEAIMHATRAARVFIIKLVSIVINTTLPPSPIAIDRVIGDFI